MERLGNYWIIFIHFQTTWIAPRIKVCFDSADFFFPLRIWESTSRGFARKQRNCTPRPDHRVSGSLLLSQPSSSCHDWPIETIQNEMTHPLQMGSIPHTLGIRSSLQILESLWIPSNCKLVLFHSNCSLLQPQHNPTSPCHLWWKETGKLENIMAGVQFYFWLCSWPFLRK